MQLNCDISEPPIKVFSEPSALAPATHVGKSSQLLVSGGRGVRVEFVELVVAFQSRAIPALSYFVLVKQLNSQAPRIEKADKDFFSM